MDQNHNMNELNWQSIAAEQGGGVDFFESALSSMVSSPTASNNGGNGGENVVLRELIGRLGTICSNNTYGEISPRPYDTNSCYSTPLNSPPKLNLSTAVESGHRLRDQIPAGNVNLQMNSFQSFAPQFSTDPGFAERAARFSCFASNNNLGAAGGFVPPSSAASSCSSSRVLPRGIHHQYSDKKLRTSESANPDSREENSDVTNAQNDAKKRKSNARAKLPSKDVPSEEASDTSAAKRIKLPEENGNEKDESATLKSCNKNSDAKTSSEPPKDYIHVRARRGQATDAHSLAERVRREKISERMKLLQDLVPGCNKITGKAVMLDEIINYVQSLQRQVEFLSMKLAAINPRMDFNVESIASSKDVFQQSFGSFPQSTYASDHCYPFQANLHSSSVHNVADRFFEAIQYNETVSQVSTYMEDDLHSVVQMGFQKNFDNGVVMTAGQMKLEQ